ncbi:MAG TPA: pyrimidine/purine nucleoside phosphorylase [Myxococcota bacterium]|nr:pyrimidine/purine nucleoside phosphorylase [Myxococcota bacterium]
MPVRERIDGVSVDTKANVYFDGRCVSHNIRLANGALSSVGVILPGKLLTFHTADPEKIELIAGRCRVKLPRSADTREFGAGESFEVPGWSRFEIEALETLHYVCHFG